ncbi:MAG: ATP-binding protein, partial [Bacteroidota bacterium]
TTQGLFRKYEEEERFERILISDRTKDQKVRAILRVSDEYHLYGTSWGLVVHNLTDDTFEVVLPHPDLEGLPNSITRIHQDSNGNIWVGTYGGLMLFEFANRRFHHPNIKSNLFPELFDSYGILHLAEYQNQLWVATLNYGFFQIALEDFFEDGTIDRPIRKWAYRNGLPDDVVYNITPDGNNNLWLATNNGISKFQLSDSTFVNYDILDGLMQDEFNMYAHARGQNGALYLGGVTGLNTIVPHEMATPNPFPPKVFFKDLTILNDTQERSIGNQLASFSLHTKEELELPYYQNFLRFTFYSDHYSSPEETTYEYKLSGVNDGWVRTTDVPSAIYTNLDPGKYTLQVRAANPDGIWGAPSSLQFTLTAPFWFDTWFYLFAISFATVLVVLAIYIRGKNSQKRQREMQATILEQTRDVHLQKDLIDAQNEEMKVSQENLTRLNNSKDFIFSILSHDLRSPLTTLKGFLGLLVESVDIFSKEEIVRLSNKIRQSVGTSLDMIDNILYWSQSQNGSISHKPQKLNLGQLAKETIEIYQLSAEKKGIELRAQVEDPLFVMADDNMLSFILRNLISNALKFTPKEGCITVVARSANEKQITLRVEDTGVGIQEEHLQKIFNPMQTYTTRGTANEKGTGLGLKLVQQFVKIHGGTFTVESTLGEGSQFIIYLPSHEGAVATAEPLG